MTTIRVIWAPETGRGDIARDGGNILTAPGLESAVLLSLFTDARADTDSTLNGSERRGWWGNELSEQPGDEFGSKLWTLFRRGKITSDLLRQGEGFAREALAWMLEDGVVGGVDATLEAIAKNTVRLTVVLKQPKGEASPWRFAWEVQLGL